MLLQQYNLFPFCLNLICQTLRSYMNSLHNRVFHKMKNISIICCRSAINLNFSPRKTCIKFCKFYLPDAANHNIYNWLKKKFKQLFIIIPPVRPQVNHIEYYRNDSIDKMHYTVLHKNQ